MTMRDKATTFFDLSPTLDDFQILLDAETRGIGWCSQRWWYTNFWLKVQNSRIPFNESMKFCFKFLSLGQWVHTDTVISLDRFTDGQMVLGLQFVKGP